MKEYRFEIKWALIYAGVMILWTLMERLAGFHDQYISMEDNVALFTLAPFGLVYLLLVLDKRKKFYHGKISYLQGFFSGIVMTVFIMALTPVFQFISTYIISPHFFENMIAYTEKEGIFTREEAAKQFSYGNFVFTNIVFEMVVGVMWAAFFPIWLKTARERT